MSKEQTGLLPCPFCGAAPHRRTGSDFTKSNYSVFCTGCFASTPIETSEETAIATWNRRASPSPAGGVQAVTDEMVERLIAALKPLVWLSRAEARPALTAALSSQAQTTGGVE